MHIEHLLCIQILKIKVKTLSARSGVRNISCTKDRFMEALSSPVGNQQMASRYIKNNIKFITTNFNAGSVGALGLFVYSKVISSMNNDSKSKLFIKQISSLFKRPKSR